MNKFLTRITALFVAVLLLITLCSGLFSARAAGVTATGGNYDPDDPQPMVLAGARLSENVNVGKVTRSVSVRFEFYLNSGIGDEYDSSDIHVSSGAFATTSDSRLRISGSSRSDGAYTATLTRLVYTGGGGTSLNFEVDGYYFNVAIPAGYFKPGEDEQGKNPAPDIVVQSVTAKNAQGEVLAEVDEDTPAFTVEIVYYDIGLVDETPASLDSAEIYAFLANSPGFTPLGGTEGQIEKLTSNRPQPYPRFRAIFRNLKSDGSANTLNFRVQYAIEDYEVQSKGEVAAVLNQIDVTKEEETDAILKPNVIISQYGYGDNPITSGDVFDLEFRFANTSSSVTVENLVVTIEPANGFVIAAASNTVFFPNMAPGENKPYTIALEAAEAITNASTGEQETEYSIMVKFAYQYLSNKTYADGSSEVKIAIPVTQLDRFTVDEITDLSEYLTVGEEGYVSVPITNKGKALIGNISGFIESATPGAEFVAPVVRHGSLEGGGKSDTVELSLTVNTPGEFSGTAVIEYEDGNMKQKRVTMPFTLMVEEPYVPEPPRDPNGMDPNAPPEQTGPGLFSLIMCGLGGLLIAAPLALYVIKRVRLRGSEDADEAF